MIGWRGLLQAKEAVHVNPWLRKGDHSLKGGKKAQNDWGIKKVRPGVAPHMARCQAEASYARTLWKAMPRTLNLTSRAMGTQ